MCILFVAIPIIECIHPLQWTRAQKYTNMSKKASQYGPISYDKAKPFCKTSLQVGMDLKKVQ